VSKNNRHQLPELREVSVPAAEIALQRSDLEVTPEKGFYSLRRGDGSGKSGVVGHFMQEGG
jgi:hypothetical protein